MARRRRCPRSTRLGSSNFNSVQPLDVLRTAGFPSAGSTRSEDCRLSESRARSGAGSDGASAWARPERPRAARLPTHPTGLGSPKGAALISDLVAKHADHDAHVHRQQRQHRIGHRPGTPPTQPTTPVGKRLEAPPRKHRHVTAKHTGSRGKSDRAQAGQSGTHVRHARFRHPAGVDDSRITHCLGARARMPTTAEPRSLVARRCASLFRGSSGRRRSSR